MSKYQILAHPKGHDTYLDDEVFDSVDKAVKAALSLVMGKDFLIIQVVDWKAEASTKGGERLMSNFIKFNDGSCIYCKEGFTAADVIEGHENGIWHPRCVPMPHINHKEEVELPVCPRVFCSSILMFPEASPTLPCAKHGLLMIPLSEAPIRKQVYRYLKQRYSRYKYATHKVNHKKED